MHKDFASDSIIVSYLTASLHYNSYMTSILYALKYMEIGRITRYIYIHADLLSYKNIFCHIKHKKCKQSSLTNLLLASTLMGEK